MLSEHEGCSNKPYFGLTEVNRNNKAKESAFPAPIRALPVFPDTVSSGSSTATTKENKVKKTYGCTQCSKSFTRPSQLQTHIYSHTAEKPFQCTSPGCSKKFSVASNLRRHLKVHQKPASSNTLSSEDRVKCVRRLMRKTSVLLSRRVDMNSQNEMRYAPEEEVDGLNKRLGAFPSPFFIYPKHTDMSAVTMGNRNSYMLPDFASNVNTSNQNPFPLQHVSQTALDNETQPASSSNVSIDNDLYGAARERQRDTLKLPNIMPKSLNYTKKAQ